MSIASPAKAGVQTQAGDWPPAFAGEVLQIARTRDIDFLQHPVHVRRIEAFAA